MTGAMIKCCLCDSVFRYRNVSHFDYAYVGHKELFYIAPVETIRSNSDTKEKCKQRLLQTTLAYITSAFS